MKHRFVPVALLLLGAHSPSSAAPASAARPDTGRYLWPLAHPPQLTSTFAEYRSGHFHAGIDLSTSGREGIPVLAVEDGEVVRVRASGAGYGRAVYLRLNDGRLAVYAHLSSMMEPLARYVEAVQDSLGRYRVDLYPPSGRFPVRRGQPVGKSGSSGAGAAHFHFELREGDVAVNPLTHGLPAQDDQLPVLRALVFTPMAAGARVNGEAKKARVPLSAGAAGAGGEFSTMKEIRIWGEVGVGMDGFDRGVGGDRLGLHWLELYVDDVQQFTARFERFDYSRNHEVEAEFDYEEVARGRRSVRNLFVPSGVLGDFHSQRAALAGVLEAGDLGAELGPGVHRLRVVASDARGNKSTATATVRVSGPPLLTGVEIVPGEDGGRHLRVDASGCGARLARVKVERGARGGTTFTAWRDVPVLEGVAVAIPIRDDLDNPHDVLRVSVVDQAGAGSNRLLALAGTDPLTVAPSGLPAGPAAPPPAVTLVPGTRLATLEVKFSSPPVSPPALSLPGSPHLLVDALDPRRFVAEIDALGQTPLQVRAVSADGGVVEAAVELPWTAVPRGGQGTYEALAGRVRIEFSAGAFFEDAYVWVEEDMSRVALPPGLARMGPVVRVEPAGLPLDRGLWVGIRSDTTAAASMSHVGLFSLDEQNAADFEGSEQADATAVSPGSSIIGARVRRLGRFVLARDVEPPTVSFLSPTHGQVLTSRQPRIRARVRDRESGFREDDVTFLIDGRRVPTEWNPEADSMQHRPTSPLSPGRHVIVAEATDRSGLVTRREITITVQ
jgi:hypothetical protein